MFNQTNPYMNIMPQMPYQNLIRVNGIDGAKSYQIGSNSTVALFDSNSDIFYVKSTDMAGFPTIRVFKFEEFHQDANSVNQKDLSAYITREEMEDYVKQFIQSNNTGTAVSTNKSKSDADD